MSFARYSKIGVYVQPPHTQFPRRGGVREHLIQLYRCIGANPHVYIAQNEDTADVVHVESSWSSKRRPDIYTCHGGFVDANGVYNPIPAVLDNLKRARIIVSVARWIVTEFFPQYAHKTVVIPNGIRLEDWANVPASGIEPGYVLYAKEWVYHIDDFIRLAELLPRQRFVSTVWPEGMKQLSNVEVIGLQSREVIRSVLKDAAALMLPGPEVCPTMLLEAWAARTPVIAVAGSGSEEIIGDGAGGLLYDEGEVEYVASRLPDLLSARSEMGDAGYARVEANYQWPRLFERYVQAYKAVWYSEVDDCLAVNAVARRGVR